MQELVPHKGEQRMEAREREWSSCEQHGARHVGVEGSYRGELVLGRGERDEQARLDFGLGRYDGEKMDCWRAGRSPHLYPVVSIY